MGVSWLQQGDAFGVSKTMVGRQLIPIVALYDQHHPHPTSSGLLAPGKQRLCWGHNRPLDPIEGEESGGAGRGVAPK